MELSFYEQNNYKENIYKLFTSLCIFSKSFALYYLQVVRTCCIVEGGCIASEVALVNQQLISFVRGT